MNISILNNIVVALVDHRIRVTIWLVVAGFVMLVATFPLGIGTMQFKGVLQNGFNAFDGAPASGENPVVTAKEVGFLAALNWSLFCTLIAPAIVWFALSTVQAFNTTLSELCKNGMIRTSDFKKIEYADLQSKWDSHISKNRILFVFILLAVIFFMMYDWWTVVGDPILNPDTIKTAISDPVMEYDWSVSSIFQNSIVNPYALLVFGFLAYLAFAALIPALVIAVSLCTIYYMFFITTLRVNDEDPNSGFVRFAAVPTAAARDRHFGFKVFSDLFHNFLLMSLFILIGLWFMAVQNIYLRDVGSTDIYSFIFGESSQYQALFSDGIGLVSFFSWFITPASFFVYNLQVALSVLLFPFVCIVSVLGCWFVLRLKARQAQEFSMQHAKIVAVEYKMKKEVFEERLQNEMDVWPVGWITSKKLLSLMLLLFLSLVSYRLIVVPLVFIGVYGAAGAIKSLIFK